MFVATTWKNPLLSTHWQKIFRHLLPMLNKTILTNSRTAPTTTKYVLKKVESASAAVQEKKCFSCGGQYQLRRRCLPLNAGCNKCGKKLSPSLKVRRPWIVRLHFCLNIVSLLWSELRLAYNLLFLFLKCKTASRYFAGYWDVGQLR